MPKFTRTGARHVALLALPLVAALALTGCKKEAATSGPPVTSASTVANVAPPAGKAWADQVVKTPDGGYLMGNPDAPIKIVEYASLTCPHCAAFATEGFPTLRDKYVASGRVSLEMRNFVRDKFDTTMAMLVRCGPTESFFPLTEQTFAAQPELFKKIEPLSQDKSIAGLPDAQLFPTLADKAGLIDFFAGRGLPKDQARACLANTQAATALADGVQKTLDKYPDFQGTPTFILNGKNTGVATWEGLEPMLKAAGAR